ncbi:MAG: thioredoxin family protein [bacterium]|nr:thioredoxin family protein [bacterium]
MKKKDKILVVIGYILIASILGLLIYFQFFKKEKIINYVDEISYLEFVNMWDNDQSFVLYIGSDSCYYCKLYTPKVEKVAKQYDIIVYYLDISKLSDEAKASFNGYINFGNVTPTTSFIIGGEELASSRISGNVSQQRIVNSFKESGFVK